MGGMILRTRINRGPRKNRTVGRATVFVLSTLLMLPLAFASISVMQQSGAENYGPTVQLLAVALILIPASMTLLQVLRSRFSIAYSVYWAWSFVFMGLAPAWQIGTGRFPWGGIFSTESIVRAQVLTLVGHAAVFLCFEISLRRRCRRRSAGTPLDAEQRRRISVTLSRASIAYVVAASLFVALMGSSLFHARAVFRSRLLTIAEMPFGGSLYFLVTAGALIVPPALIVARREGVQWPRPLGYLAISLAAIVTNPLLGSRFLTGSFLVACLVAFLRHSVLLRAVPVLSVVLLVTVFPTLDVLRGDGSGSSGVEFLSAEDALTTYDFDAFEMQAREVELKRSPRNGLPTSTQVVAAPLMRWIPLLARSYIGDASGTLVAERTGMQYTNVSMPLWGEGDLIGGALGVVLLLGLLGSWMAVSTEPIRKSGQNIDTRSFASAASAPSCAALLFIILRGSLYEVFAYGALVAMGYIALRRAGARRSTGAGDIARHGCDRRRLNVDGQA